MRNIKLSTWIALGAGACTLAVTSCCCFTGLVGALAPAGDRPPPPVTSAPVEPAPPLPLPVFAPAPVHPLCVDFDAGSLPRLDHEARIDLAVIADDGNQPTVRVGHNLPVGTVIAIDVSAGNVGGGTLRADDGRYNDNVEVEVDGPCFVAGPFRPMPPGRYTVTAVTPAFAQPAHLEAVLGPNHRRLRGSQVHTAMGIRIVRANQALRIR